VLRVDLSQPSLFPLNQVGREGEPGDEALVVCGAVEVIGRGVDVSTGSRLRSVRASRELRCLE
jgi:hypothetical protein